jgi:hypothetical protein
MIHYNPRVSSFFQVIIRAQSGGMRAAGYLPSARETDIKPANHVEERIGLRSVLLLL